MITVSMTEEEKKRYDVFKSQDKERIKNEEIVKKISEIEKSEKRIEKLRTSLSEERNNFKNLKVELKEIKKK